MTHDPREALERICQRANETGGTSTMALVDTIHAIHGIAREALRREAPASSGVEGAGIDAAAEYLVRTVKRTLWDSLRKDGRARDGGFEPFPHNPRQEDYRDVVREIVRLAAPSRPDAGGEVREAATLRLCGYCQSWNSKPCGEQCHWLPTDPTLEQMRAKNIEATRKHYRKHPLPVTYEKKMP